MCRLTKPLILLILLSIISIHSSDLKASDSPLNAYQTKSLAEKIKSGYEVMTDGAVLGDLIDSESICLHESTSKAVLSCVFHFEETLSDRFAHKVRVTAKVSYLDEIEGENIYNLKFESKK